MITTYKLLISLAAAILLTACAVGPDYRRPDVVTPAAFKEAGDWKSAEPKDEVPRGNWWERYGDSDLNALVKQVELSNQNVLGAVAQYRQALALLGTARAEYFPTLGASLSRSRAQNATAGGLGVSGTSTGNGSSAPITDTTRLAYNASWEADIWGRIGRNVESSESSAQASEADLRSALLSAQATLVQTYMQLRATDVQQHLLEQTVAAYERSLKITRDRYAAGVAGRVDVAQAETQLASTQAQALDLAAQRAQYEHAIAVLVGKAPADFQLAPTYVMPALPMLPATLPAELLERRPDIAAAERRMAAANAQIGVAQAAYFPALSLSSAGGYQNSTLANLLSLPNRFWSIGPTLALTLFDGGARSAQKAGALAGYDKAVASYRQTVLAAFQEVEDSLSALRQLNAESKVQQAATRSALEVLTLTENQYKAGVVSYLNVVTAQASALGAQRSSIEIASRRLVADATLLKAMGGGWHEGTGAANTGTGTTESSASP